MPRRRPRRPRPYAGSSAVSAVAGVWIAFSPWLFHYADNLPALWSSILAGMVVTVLALARFLRPKGSAGLSWINLAIALWVIATPWIFDFAANVVAAWDKVVVGLILAVFAWSSAMTARRRHRPI